MKVLFNCHVPSCIAHGGQQIQIAQTMRGLREIGVDAEPIRWWDESQTGDLIQHFGRLPSNLIQLAQRKGMRVITADLLTAQGSRPRWRLALQSTLNAGLRRFAPRQVAASFNWHAYTETDACIANTPWEARLMTEMFGAPPQKVFVIPNGVEAEFLNSPPRERGPWLICTGTITERKRVVELAEAAVQAQTPVWIIGKPYSASDPYGQRFLKLAQEHPRFVRYEGPISKREPMAAAYRAARGFVLLSTMETRSLSSEEAAACGCPLLLSDLPWARSVFKDSATYCPIAGPSATTKHLRQFYAAAPTLPPPPRPMSWEEVARQLRTVYEGVLAG